MARPQADYTHKDFLNDLLTDLIERSITTTEGSNIDIVTFANSILFNDSTTKLWPTQEAILKAIYNEPLDQVHKDILNLWREQGKTNWVDGRHYTNMILEAGRGSSKSSMSSIICLYEFYKLISLPDPGLHHGLMSFSPIALFAIAQTEAQVLETSFKAVKSFLEGSNFFKSLIKKKKIIVLSDEIKCPDKFVSLYAKHTNSKALVGYNLKLLFIDEMARFETTNDAINTGLNIYENIGRGCHLETSLIQTKKGKQPVKDVLKEFNNSEKPELLTLNKDTYQYFYTSNIDAWDNGIHEVLNIKTKTGKEEQVTTEHPFLVWRKDDLYPNWVEAQNLNVGDRIATLNQLPFIDQSTITKEQAYILGLLFGDGCITTRGISFTNNDLIIMNSFRDALSIAFPTASIINRVDKKDPNRTYDYRINGGIHPSKANPFSNPISNWLERIGVLGCNAHTKRIPECISTGNKEQIAAFLRGMYCTDGFVCSHKDKIEISIALCTEDLIKDIQIELLKFNIYSWYRVKDSMGGIVKKISRSYYLEIADAQSIINFVEQIGFVGDREPKQKEVYERALQKLNGSPSKSNSNLWPIGVKNILNKMYRSNKISYKKIGVSGTFFAENCKVSRHVIKKFLNKIPNQTLQNLFDAPIMWEEIVDITSLGCLPTVGFEIKDTGIIANPIISHNTNRFKGQGKKIVVSSAWSFTDPMVTLKHMAAGDPYSLIMELTCFDVNPTISRSNPDIISDYASNPKRARLEYENIRSSNENSFLESEVLDKLCRLQSSLDVTEYNLDIDDRYFKGIKINRISNINTACFIHVDTSLKKDATAMSIATINNVGQIEIIGVACWTPGIDEKGKFREVSYINIEEILIYISQYMNIISITFDGHNSASLNQNLYSRGLNTKILSFSRDKQLSYYNLLRQLIQRGDVLFPLDSPWTAIIKTDLPSLVIKDNGQIVHPYGSKDLPDALACSVFEAYTYGSNCNLINKIELKAPRLININTPRKIVPGSSINRLERHKQQLAYRTF
jgi:intein/homing endonuclease